MEYLEQYEGACEAHEDTAAQFRLTEWNMQLCSKCLHTADSGLIECHSCKAFVAFVSLGAADCMDDSMVLCTTCYEALNQHCEATAERLQQAHQATVSPKRRRVASPGLPDVRDG